MKKLAGVLAGIWLGLQLGTGYLVAPVLFRNLPKMQAGNLVGVLFDVVAYIGLGVWLLVYFAGLAEGRRGYVRTHTGKWVLLLLALLAANRFLVTPVIEALKTGGTNRLLSLAGGSFGQWHGASSIIYMLCSLLGLWLVLRLVEFKWR